ncbi:hypothetical protein AXW67_39245 [Bradyrhizobium neotropicale]|uniref:Uncharacterized protein n=1 Tax=Bradyrhizobium neotropicale TaxID=1497615 RepID=A0A176ZET1_9BRAD|nr:hypothetical protein AXW67_39245 [Bradyrhizobium neotropicale]
MLAQRFAPALVIPTSIRWGLKNAARLVAGERTTAIFQAEFSLLLHVEDWVAALQKYHSIIGCCKQNFAVIGRVAFRLSESVRAVFAHLQPSPLAADQRIVKLRICRLAQEFEIRGAHRLVGLFQFGSRAE